MKSLLTRFDISDGFMGRYVALTREKIIPYQEKMLRNQNPDAVPSYAIENFRLAAQLNRTGKCEGQFHGEAWQDSDVSKWLEAAAYSMAKQPDADLEKHCDEVIQLISEAQLEDGYIDTYFIVQKQELRWTNLEEAHELYCIGHLIEAGVAYAECIGKTRLLEVACRAADHVYQRFVVEKTPGYPGHPEIELALLRLYHYTQEEKYLRLAMHFLDVRGVDSDYFIKESRKNDWTIWGNCPENKEYMQCCAPVRQQSDATGHAVRAVYLYTAMADAARTVNDPELFAACKRLWKSITERRMYITGGIGSAYEGEAFTKDYHLPNDTAYAETCASIGLIFFARRMLEMEAWGGYGDVMERALYNCVLAGMALDGETYFYVNPLEVVPGISGEAVTHRHVRTTRPRWFPCACCPPNVARLIASIGEYAWGISEGTVYSHLFLKGTLDVKDLFGGKIVLDTAYPYDGLLRYTFLPDGDKMEMELAVRLPEWSENTVITKNGRPAQEKREKGYAYLAGPFAPGDVVEVRLDMSVHRNYADPRVGSDYGKIAFSRGPLLYCAEEPDNEGDLRRVCVAENSAVTVLPYDPDKLCGIVELETDGYAAGETDTLYGRCKPEKKPQRLRLIPYYAWANRGVAQMRVWLPEIERPAASL